MNWLATNWIWIVIGVAFVGLHMFGHGGHGSHPAEKRPEGAPGDAGTVSGDSPDEKKPSHSH